MKKLLFLTAAVCMLAAAAFAQDKKGADFSGTWTLDVAKSKLDERMRVESMTMTVAQTPTELSVTTETKRPAPPADAPVRPGGGGRGGFGGDGKAVYSLEGKETKLEIDGPNGKIPQALKAKAEGNEAEFVPVNDDDDPRRRNHDHDKRDVGARCRRQVAHR